MSLSGPFFHAWCDDRDRVDAYAAALSALLSPKWWSGPPSVEELVSAAGAEFGTETHIANGRSVKLHSGDMLNIDLAARRDEYNGGDSRGPQRLQPDERTELLVLKMQMARGGVRSVEVEAAVLGLVTLENIKDLLLRLCAPDNAKRVTTGACTWFGNWGPPIHACATYSSDAHVARDLALSWLHTHAKEDVDHIAGLPLDTLQARVEGAPHGARISLASELKLLRDKDAVQTYLDLPVPVRMTVRGARLDLVGEHEMTREQVLATLDTPADTLLEALEAAALPNEDWRAVEVLALETIRAKEQGTPCDEVWVNSRGHVRFIERHAPYHVRRLPNGGVLLATHPYRTLWQLWADALLLLGIRTDSGSPT
jgi:hypothetical protein